MLKFIEIMQPVRGQLEKFRTLACVMLSRSPPRHCSLDHVHVTALLIISTPCSQSLQWYRYMVQRRERVKSAHTIADFQALNHRQALVRGFGTRAEPPSVFDC